MSELIHRLRDTFGVAFIGPNGDIQVKCPACVHRGMGEDGSGRSAPGHLGLNFKKNVGYCVRCAYGIGNLHRWLAKRNIETPYVASVIKASNADFWMEAAPGGEPPAYKVQRIELPRGCKPIRAEDHAATPFIDSLISKRLTIDQIISARIMYAIEGRLAGYCIFPVYEDDELVYWQARAVWPDRPDKKNPHKSEVEMGKSYWLYGVDDAVIGGFMVLVEGGLDRITAHSFIQRECGSTHYALGLLGASIGRPKAGEHWMQSQLGKIVALNPSSVCVLFDGPKHRTDPGAYGKAVAVASEISACGIQAYAGRLDHGDPNEASDDMLRTAIFQRESFNIDTPCHL